MNGSAPGLIGDTQGMSKRDPKDVNSKAKNLLPLYRAGEKWDIAMAALYLSSDAGLLISYLPDFKFT